MNLGVEHDGPKDANAVHGCAEVAKLLLLVLAGSVREVEAHDAIVGVRSSRRSVRSGRACTQSWSWVEAESSTPSPPSPVAIAARSSRGTGGRKEKHACVIEIDHHPVVGLIVNAQALGILVDVVRLRARLELPLEIDFAGGSSCSANADSTGGGRVLRRNQLQWRRHYVDFGGEQGLGFQGICRRQLFFSFFIRVDV
jgi:hypothetical protein